MSGPEETSESAVDSASPASEGTPSAPAPPSFGQAGAPAPQSAQQSESRQTESFTVPLFGPNKPWWASSEDDRDTFGPETGSPSGVPASEAGAPEGTEPETIEPETAGTAETPRPPAAPPADPAEPGTAPGPGFLVAGVDVPSVDTRGAVPPDPIKELPGPAYPDTDPDGIPLYAGPQPDQNDQQPASPAAIPAACRPGLPAAQAPQHDGTAPRTASTAAAETVPDDLEGALTPDAVIPPGVTPPGYTGHRHEGLPHTAPAAPADQASDSGVILVVSQTSEETTPQPAPETDAGQQPPAPAEQPVVRRRNQLMIAVVAIVILIPVTVLAAFGLASGSGEATSAAERPSRSATPTPQRSASAAPPAATPSASPSPTAKRSGSSRIDSERTDPRPLALVEVFPTKEIQLAERSFVQDMTSVNHQCELTARGAMIDALERGKCRSVVRATYVNRAGTIAVTAGVAVMPTHKAALAAHKAGDPSAYEWFRGMPGKRSPDIDRAGGHAAGKVRGRYIIYAYATYTDDDTESEPGDPVLKEVANEFIAYGLRPIDKRAEGS